MAFIYRFMVVCEEIMKLLDSFLEKCPLKVVIINTFEQYFLQISNFNPDLSYNLVVIYFFKQSHPR